MNKTRLEQKIILVSLDTIQFLFNEEEGSDLVSLYMFYHKQCKIQKTNQSWTTGAFIMKGLGWGKKRVSFAKNKLIELGLVEDIVDRGEDGKVKGWYVQLNYIENHMDQSPLVAEATSGYQKTNAGNNKYINAGSIKSEMLEDETQKNDSLEESTSLPFSSYTEGNLQQETNNKLTSISKESHIEKKQKIPSIEEIRNKYPKKMIMEYFHKIMSQTKFADKTDINSFQEYHDHIVDKFCIAYGWRKENVGNYKDYVYYVIEEFRVHYALEEDEIKNFKGRLSTWIKNSIKYTLPRYNREHPGDAIALNV